MNAQEIATVLHKEILLNLRDKRALLTSLLMPVILIPLLVFGLPLLIEGIFDREMGQVTEVAISNANELSPEIKMAFTANQIQLVDVDDPMAAVQGDDVLVGIRVPEGFARALRQGDSSSLELIAKLNSMRSELLLSKIEASVQQFEKELVSQRLSALELDKNYIEPIDILRLDAQEQSAQSSTGLLSWMVVFLVMMWTLVGGQMPAIDATAGEKERSSLEATLLSPIRRSSIVIAKFLAVFVFASASALMGIFSYVGSSVILTNLNQRSSIFASEAAFEQAFGTLNTSWQNTLLMILTSVVLAALISALQIFLSMFANSLKQAQSYLAPLTFLIMIPGIALQFIDFFTLNVWTYSIPLLSSLLSFDDLLKNQLAPLHFLVSISSNLALCALLLYLAHKNFQREGIIFAH